eukprot:scaffold11878_cov75-Phaeocystis_antarctica.AAC.2
MALWVGEQQLDVRRSALELGLVDKQEVRVEAATLCEKGCNPMWSRLQPCVIEAAALGARRGARAAAAAQGLEAQAVARGGAGAHNAAAPARRQLRRAACRLLRAGGAAGCRVPAAVRRRYARARGDAGRRGHGGRRPGRGGEGEVKAR